MGMTRTEIEHQMESVFKKVAPEIEFKKLDPNRPLFIQVEIDSYDFMTILTQLEANLGIRVPDSVVRDLPNINALLDYLEQHSK